MVKVLLVNPSMAELYIKAKVKSSVPNYFPLNLLTIATPLIEKNHEVKILDMNFYTDIKSALTDCLFGFKPDYVGITFTTPLYSQSLYMASVVKEYDKKIIVVSGGVHTSSVSVDTLEKSEIDIAVVGEGDFKLPEIIEAGAEGLEKVKGIAYKKGGKVFANEREPYIKDPDVVPFPATGLIDIWSYKVPHTYCRKNPVFPLETSRGCIYGCVYCNKSVFGRTFRFKSTKRVIEDLKRIQGLGYREVHIIDDGFTTDMERAKDICRQIISEKIKLHFNCPNGIRADRVDLELLTLMKKAGFYRVAFGVETGSPKILELIEKNLKMSDISKAFELCKKIGIETTAFFMFGLPEETEEDLKATIRFAKKLKPDIAKFDIMIPMPSTPVFEEWKRKGYIISDNWDDYGIYKEKKVYNHPYLSLEVMLMYLNLAYKSFYLSPAFVFRRFFKSLMEGTLIGDLKIMFSTKW